MKMMEVWKPIEGYEGYYEVSNHGSVRSLDRVVKRINGSYGSKTYTAKGTILKRSLTNTGYHKVVLTKNSNRINRYVHQLVADAFIEVKPKKCKYEVMHLDGIRTNNHISNLRYGSHSCNLAFQVEHGTIYRGEKHHSARLSKTEVKKIKKLIGKGQGICSISKRFNMSNGAIYAISTGRSWGWLT